MNLREIMSTPVLTVPSSEPASDALAWMRDARVRHAVVLDGRSVIGVLTERDLGGPYGGAVRKGRTASDLMRPEPFVAAPDLSVREAAALVRRHRIGCIPVVDSGELVGIVTRGDLLTALAGLRRRERDRSAALAGAEVPRPPHPASPNRDKFP